MDTQNDITQGFSQRPASLLSQKFAGKVSLMRKALLQPRQGRKIVAQGVSPGVEGPLPALHHTVQGPAFGTPLPHGRERGRG